MVDKLTDIILTILVSIVIIVMTISLIYVSIQVETLQDELLQYKKMLIQKEGWVSSYKSLYLSEKNKTSQLQEELNIFLQQNENLTNKMKILERDRASLIDELSNEYKKYNKLREQKGITKATYSEVKQFLREDKTNEGEWIEFDHDCTQFAAELMNNSWRKGIQACVVELEYIHGYGYIWFVFH